MGIDPKKYATFNRQELLDALALRTANDPVLYETLRKVLTKIEIDDAVVIRRQDLFAAPALHGYAASIDVAIRMGDPASMRDLKAVADYFHEQAVLADAESYKLPD